MNTLRYLVVLLLVSFLSSCAQKQWQNSLEPDQIDTLRTEISALQQQKNSCPTSVDSDITATWSIPLQNGGMTGILQVYSPSYIKLIALNPLSQPLYALTFDGKKFQALDVINGLYLFGRAEHFAARNGIPSSFLEGNWAEWITAKASFTPEQILDIREDKNNRGIWLQIGNPKSGRIKDYILYDLKNGHILERIPFSLKGNEIATITYDNWTDASPCALPQSIAVTKSSFGADISIQLSDVKPGKDFDRSTFFMKIPPSYQRQYYP